jgi:hypothetical protein
MTFTRTRPRSLQRRSLTIAMEAASIAPHAMALVPQVPRTAMTTTPSGKTPVRLVGQRLVARRAHRYRIPTNLERGSLEAQAPLPAQQKLQLVLGAPATLAITAPRVPARGLTPVHRTSRAQMVPRGQDTDPTGIITSTRCIAPQQPRMLRARLPPVPRAAPVTALPLLTAAIHSRGVHPACLLKTSIRILTPIRRRWHLGVLLPPWRADGRLQARGSNSTQPTRCTTLRTQPRETMCLRGGRSRPPAPSPKAAPRRARRPDRKRARRRPRRGQGQAPSQSPRLQACPRAAGSCAQAAGSICPLPPCPPVVRLLPAEASRPTTSSPTTHSRNSAPEGLASPRPRPPRGAGLSPLASPGRARRGRSCCMVTALEPMAAAAAADTGTRHHRRP